MEANIIKIGNSKGIILPSKIMKIIGLKERVNIELEGKRILITPAAEEAREGWEEIIKTEIEKKGQPEHLMPDVFKDEQTGEWEW